MKRKKLKQFMDLIQCDVCGVCYNPTSTHNTEDCDYYLEEWRIKETCGTYETQCSCHDCEVYFNPKTERPIINQDLTAEEVAYIQSVIVRPKVQDLMCEERFRAKLYEKIPYENWKKLSDPKLRKELIQQLKESGDISSETFEVCEITSSHLIDLDKKSHDLYCVSYRFPTSTVKYRMDIRKDTGELSFNSRGAEYYEF